METNKVLQLVVNFAFVTLSIIGNYFIFNVRRYLKTKVPGAKTILDEFYIIYLSYWIFEIFWFIVTQPLLSFWNDIPWLLLVGFFYSAALIIIVSHFHLFLCLMCNIIIIYNPNIMENIDDNKTIISAM